MSVNMEEAAKKRAHKNTLMIRQRLGMVGQNTVAAALGTSESTVSRFKDSEIEKVGLMLAVMGLKVVPLEMKCYPSQQIDALFVLAQARMREMESADQLSCEAD